MSDWKVRAKNDNANRVCGDCGEYIEVGAPYVYDGIGESFDLACALKSEQEDKELAERHISEIQIAISMAVARMHKGRA